MNIAQLSEQLKDVPQNRLIDYARNPNSVVPQFLALAEIQRRQHLQSQAAPAPATVAEDVLGQANPQVTPEMMAQQLPENQPGVAQLPTGMPQGMASGGIVAFADGGDVEDEDYQDYLDKVERSKRRSRLDEALSYVKDRVAGVSDAVASKAKDTVAGIRDLLPESYESAKAKISGEVGVSDKKRGTHPLEAQAIAAAKEVGLDPSIMLHALYKETGGHKDPATAVSKAGAYGPMQLMEAAAKEVGVNRKDVYENLLGGARYLKKQVDTFQDPVLGLAAYNAGPGRIKQMLKRGQGIESLPAETQGYVRRAEGGITKLAQGGKVPGFYEGQKISLDDYYTGQDVGDVEGYARAPLNMPDESRYSSIYKEIEEDRQAAKEQAQTDKYLAMLQASLGMMAGSSPYALQNIGQGAMQGVSAYATMNKNRAADIAALRKAKIAALEGEGIEEVRRYGIKERAAAAEEATAQRKEAAETRSKLLSQKEINDAREAALARFNSDPAVKRIAAKIEETTPGTPEYEWYTNELNRLRNNALAQAKVEGAVLVPAASPFPLAKVDVPGGISQWWNNYSPEDIKALEWANANPLDPRANLIKERFKK